MKTNKIFIYAIALTLALANSCQKNELEDLNQKEVPVVTLELSAITEAGAATKLSLGTGLKPEWQANDELGVYDGTTIQKFQLSESNGSEAIFGGVVAEGATEFHAIFPYSSAVSFAGDSFTANIPATQTIAVGDSVATDVLMAVARATKPAEGNVQFSFKNVCGLIKVVIPESGKISQVVIKGKSEEILAGIGTVTVVDEPVFTPSATEGAKSITLLPSGETFDAGNYYAAVAPVNFTAGFTISLVRTDGAAGNLGTDKTMSVTRNGGTNLSDVVTLSDWSWYIMNKEQLFQWAQGDRKNTDLVELGADIDLAGETWTPVNFSGTFDGHGHKIYNISMSRDGYCGFFNILYGTVRNLVLGSADGTTYDGVSVFEHINEGSTSWSYIGSIAGVIQNNAVIDNVTNFVTLRVPENAGSAKVCMGGLVSFGEGTNQIINSNNYGEIILNAAEGQTTGASNHQIGGIMSKSDGVVTITNCKNYGNITAAGQYVDNIGGILGNPNGNLADTGASKTTVKDCYNYGDINVTKTTSSVSPLALGGIVGKLTGAEINNCHNQGKITSACDEVTNVGGIAGHNLSQFPSEIIGCTNGVSGDTEKGTVVYTAGGTESKSLVIGGILGKSNFSVANSALQLQNVTNYAPISINNASISFAGGICGSSDGTSISIINAENRGGVTINPPKIVGTLSIGGISGTITASETLTATIKNCNNYGDVIVNAGTGGGESQVSGISGRLGAGATIDGCTNNGEIKVLGSTIKPRVGGVVGVAQANSAIKNSYNKGNVTSASNNGQPYVGGISGYAKTMNIDNCYNKANVSITVVGSGSPMLGGILGQNADAVNINGCENSGEILCTAGKGTFHIGGIAAISTTNSSVTNCINKGTVKISQTEQHSYCGGIVGEGRGTISNCENASTALVINEHPSTNAKYALAGGIVGKSNADATIENCVNNGTVKALLFTDNRLAGAGGIIGQPQQKVTLRGNTNNGLVYGSNAHASARIYVGGIIATDCEKEKVNGAIEVKNNINYGKVELEVPTPSATNNLITSLPGSAAGGLFGGICYSNIADNSNVNYGEVVTKTNAGPGNAGALAGISHIAAWEGKVGQNVVVNGTPWSTSVLDTWICPAAKNSVTATYVPAP